MTRNGDGTTVKALVLETALWKVLPMALLLLVLVAANSWRPRQFVTIETRVKSATFTTSDVPTQTLLDHRNDISSLTISGFKKISVPAAKIEVLDGDGYQPDLLKNGKLVLTPAPPPAKATGAKITIHPGPPAPLTTASISAEASKVVVFTAFSKRLSLELRGLEQTGTVQLPQNKFRLTVQGSSLNSVEHQSVTLRVDPHDETLQSTLTYTPASSTGFKFKFAKDTVGDLLNSKGFKVKKVNFDGGKGRQTTLVGQGSIKFGIPSAPQKEVTLAPKDILQLSDLSDPKTDFQVTEASLGPGAVLHMKLTGRPGALKFGPSGQLTDPRPTYLETVWVNKTNRIIYQILIAAFGVLVTFNKWVMRRLGWRKTS